jgi:transposase
MWTNENRAKYNRDHLRYPSDVTDEEWALIEPLVPPAKRGGRRRETDMRQTFNAIMYLLSTGCQWRYIPKDFPPQGTVRRYFDAWSWRDVLGRMHDVLYLLCREQEERDASPTAAIIDSQSVKSAEKGGPRLIRPGSTRARKSRARSAIFS